MPGQTVPTIFSQSRKAGNAPVASTWHPTAKSGQNSPTLPHSTVPWVGAHPQTTLQTIPIKGK